MNAKELIKKHIEKQIETLDDWTSAKPEIRNRILKQDKKIKALDTEIKDLKIMISRLEHQNRQQKKQFKLF